LSVEDEIGAEVNESGAVVATKLGNVTRALAINCTSAVWFVLAKINAGVGGAVEHERRAVGVEVARELVAVGDVALGAAREDRRDAARPQDAVEVLRQHAAAAGDDDGLIHVQR
jgi:hypothetical protein